MNQKTFDSKDEIKERENHKNHHEERKVENSAFIIEHTTRTELEHQR